MEASDVRIFLMHQILSGPVASFAEYPNDLTSGHWQTSVTLNSPRAVNPTF